MCEKATKYAGEVDAPMRKNAHITVTDMLKPVTEDDDEPFSHVFSKYSIFKLSFKKVEDAEGIDANLPIDEWQDFEEGATAASAAVMAALNTGKTSVKADTEPEAPQETAPTQQVSIAFTPLTMGKMKGETPGDLLLGASEPDKVIAELNSHKEFLGKNVAKYPKNQALIDAIDEALNLYDLGMLAESKPQAGPAPSRKTAEAPTGGDLIVYQSGIKYFRKKNAAGKNKCYEFSIYCNPGRNFPYRMEFRNFYAPVKDNMIILKEKDEIEMNASFNMSRSEFNKMRFRMQMTIDTFIATYGPAMRMEDEKRRWKPTISATA